MARRKKPGTQAERKRESGQPGGGAGRRDEVGGSGVYPASAGSAPDDAVIRSPMAWGQGDRGAEGYEDTGPSELHFTEEELQAARRQRRQPEREAGRSEDGSRNRGE